MPQLIVRYDAAGVGAMLKAAETLASPAKIERALHEGVRAAGDKVRTVVRKSLHRQMGTKRYGVIVANTRSYIPGRMTYAIDGTGKGLDIVEFPVRAGKREMARFDPRNRWKRQPRDGRGRFGKLPDTVEQQLGGVVASPWRVTHRFKRSYVAADGVYRAWLPGKKGKGRRLYGPSLAKEIVKAGTRDAFEAQASQEMSIQVAKRLKRLLP